MKQNVTLKKMLMLTLATLLALPATPAYGSSQMLREQKKNQASLSPQKPKLAPDLEELLAFDDEQEQAKKKGAKTLADKRSEKFKRQLVGKVVLPSEGVTPEEKQSFVVELNGAASSAALKARLASFGASVRRSHTGMGLVAIEASRSVIRQLAADNLIAYVSPDRLVESTQWHLGNATGTYNVGISDRGDSDPNSWLVGSNIGMAVIDSGVDGVHTAMAWPTMSKVIYSVDFTGQNINGDPYGHGSHVASLAAGEGIDNVGYKSLAPGALVWSLRVLDGDGRGALSNVVSAIDWVVYNRNSGHVPIRVINMSLGTMAKDSYVNDPLCLAARRAVNAGLVVVASAGNNGKKSNGQKIYGAINSPGIEPSVITVGASNTYGTDVRSDDTVTTFSSRGPTRGYRTVWNGSAYVRKYDNLIKPDLVAPGNKLIAARGFYNGQENKLAKDNPGLKTGSQTSNTQKVMYMSGTSMAAPIVASAAAMLLETNPSLTPMLVKAILMYSAEPLKGFNMFEQGAGQLNVDGAVRLARLVKTTLPTTVGASLLNASLPTSQSSSICGATARWSQGVITNWGFLYGSALMQSWQSVYGSGVVLADATAVSGTSLIRVSGRTSSGVLLKNGAVKITSSGVMLADGVVMADGVMLSDGVMLADGVVMADGVMLSDGVVMADGTTRADTNLKSATAVYGDNTAGMPPAP